MGYRRKDPYYQRAKAAGYRARSAYKLIELDRRFGLLRRGDHVLDLGAWPGTWLQVALERVGPTGRVVGVDVASVASLGQPNVALVIGDLRQASTLHAAREQLGRRADVVLSDVAPKLTGVRATDEARRAELATAILDALPDLLRPGGRFLMKLFSDAEHAGIVARLRGEFDELKTTRPAATRKASAETYVAGKGYRCGKPVD
jgi:23S rRNA (uridine2552-2'-O)-methyltransferase